MRCRQARQHAPVGPARTAPKPKPKPAQTAEDDVFFVEENMASIIERKFKLAERLMQQGELEKASEVMAQAQAMAAQIRGS